MSSDQSVSDNTVCDHRVTKIVRASLLASLAAMSVVACGGGGGSGPTPSPPMLPPTSPPPPAPPPPAPPPPPPPPASFFETSEYFGSGFRSSGGQNNIGSGLGLIHASSAYAAGATGAGITVAVIDTNVDTSISELTGQLAGTFDVNATGRAADDIDSNGHGTMVTSVIVANKDGVGIHGVAFDAKVLAIRADTRGTCQTTGEDEGCKFNDNALSTAIDYAISHGARVINMSLGGEPDLDPTLENAVRRAAAAGILVVISAGNEGKAPTSTDPAEGTSPTEPAYIAGLASSLGRVVAVGAVDNNGKMATFSNRAGATKNYYLLAPGASLIVAGVDDNIRNPTAPDCSATVTTNCNDTDTDGDYWLASGTSFSAPHVAGALALMLSLFPNIKPEDALSALLMTADDYIDTNPDAVLGIAAGVGADTVSGVGILNLQRAFAPIGPTAIDLGSGKVPLAQALSPAAGALGDWIDHSGAFDGLVFQDMFDRGFRIGEASTGPARAPFADFGLRARYARGQARAVEVGPASLSWFNAPPEPYDPRKPWAEAPDPTFEMHYRFSDGGELATGRGGGPQRLTPGLMLVQDASGPTTLDSGQAWASVAQTFGPITLDMRSASGEGRSASSVGFGHTGDGWAMRFGLSSMRDERTTLGGALQSRFGEQDGERMSAASFESRVEAGAWRLSGAVEAASVRIDSAAVSGLWTSAWSLSAEHDFAGGALRLSAAQPRRAEGGALTFNGPVEVLKSGALRFETRTPGLTPSGREFDIETAWTTRLGPQTTLEAAGVVSMQPNHVADADPAAALWLGVRHVW
jgi:subtilisin family serine protease